MLRRMSYLPKSPRKLDADDRVGQKWIAAGIADRIARLAGSVDREVLRDLAARAIAEALAQEGRRKP
jgi:hypothetical protein